MCSQTTLSPIDGSVISIVEWGVDILWHIKAVGACKVGKAMALPLFEP